jgi:hypothetical protein
VIKTHWRTILLAGGAFVLPDAVAFIIASGVLNHAVLTHELSQGSVLASSSLPGSALYCVFRTSLTSAIVMAGHDSS